MNKINLEQADENVMKFLTSLLEQKGMGILPDNLVIDMLMDLYSRFQSFLFVAVMNEMDENTLAKFNELLGNEASMEDSYVFFKANVPNMEEIIANTMNEFTNTYLNG